MAWFLIARLLCIAAIGYSAYQLEPLIGGPVVNTLFGVVLGLAVVVFEIRLKDSSVTHMLGALIGGKKGAAIGTAVGGGGGAAVVLATPGDEIRLARGAALTLVLDEPIEVRVPVTKS